VRNSLKVDLAIALFRARAFGQGSGGDGGTTPVLAVVINAIVDALAELGVRHG
jgi:carbon-monoxide dehydrogenase large subunit